MKKKIKISVIVEENFYEDESVVKILSNLVNIKNISVNKIFLTDNRKNNQKNFFINILNKFIFFMEKKHKKNNIININKKIKTIKKINLKIENNSTHKISHYINDEDSKKIKKENLEVLINLTDFIILTKIKKIASKGIMGCIKENYNSNLSTQGFHSSYNDVEFMNIFIYLIQDNKHFLNIIDTGYYNPKKYWLLNSSFLNEKTKIIFLKNIKLILCNQKISSTKKIRINNISFKNIKLTDLIFYIVKKYIFFIFQKKEKENWSLSLSTSKFGLSFKNCLNFIPPKKNFWADPFLFRFNTKKYVFFENYNYKEKKGFISYFDLKEPGKVFDAIKKKYHLSYPFIFKHKKQILMIPETSQNKRIEIWKSKNFPKKWYLYKKIFIGSSFADCSILNYKNQLWLFANKSEDNFLDHNSELYIYKIEGNNFNKLIPHKQNPVICDSRSARNAGAVYKKNGKYYRPSQININKVYGYGLNINQIMELNINRYTEKNVTKFTPFSNEIKNTHVHHISILDDKIIFDKKSQI